MIDWMTLVVYFADEQRQQRFCKTHLSRKVIVGSEGPNPFVFAPRETSTQLQLEAKGSRQGQPGFDFFRVDSRGTFSLKKIAKSCTGYTSSSIV